MVSLIYSFLGKSSFQTILELTLKTQVNVAKKMSGYLKVEMTERRKRQNKRSKNQS